MAKKEREPLIPGFKDIDERLSSRFLSEFIADGVICLILCVLAIALGVPSVALLFLAGGIFYAIYVLFKIKTCTDGKCLMLSGRVIKSEAAPKNKIKTTINAFQKKNVSNRITVKLTNDVTLDIDLHERNQYSPGNDITIFAPLSQVYSKTEDHGRLFGYYLICLDRENADASDNSVDNSGK